MMINLGDNTYFSLTSSLLYLPVGQSCVDQKTTRLIKSATRKLYQQDVNPFMVVTQTIHWLIHRNGVLINLIGLNSIKLFTDHI